MAIENKKVLIVEDDAAIAELMVTRLEKMGITVVSKVTFGEDALKRAQETRPDLIVMDIILEGSMDGMEAGMKIRQELNIPIVYITGSDEKSEILQKNGIIPLIKPFSTEEFNSVIELAFLKEDWKNEPE